MTQHPVSVLQLDYVIFLSIQRPAPEPFGYKLLPHAKNIEDLAVNRTRWGVLGCADIAIKRVIPAMLESELCAVQAIASRSAANAKKIASDFNLPRYFGNYQDLLDDPEIDAVYIPLPNHLHVEWSIKALHAGKHVLCEKPISCSYADLHPLINARDRTGLMVEEAFMVRDHPQWQRLQQILSSGRIGDVRNVQLSYSHFSEQPSDIRFRSDFGGGSLLDVGSYCCTIARLIYGQQPVRAMALADQARGHDVDRSTTALLEFPSGHASFFCSMQSSRYQMVQIVGSAGWIRVEVPFAHPASLGARLVIGKHEAPGTEADEIIHFDPVNQYRLQADRFCRQIRGQLESQWPLETALENMRTIDAIRESSHNGQWVVVASI